MKRNTLLFDKIRAEAKAGKTDAELSKIFKLPEINIAAITRKVREKQT
jgi:hypothetical protein